MDCKIKRVIQLNEPISYLSVKVIDNNGADVSETSMYSWSSDGVCWTNWAEKNTYDTACKNIDTDFYLRILIFGGFSELWLNGTITSCFRISLYNENPFVQSFCENKNLFNPYANLDCALQLQQQMADSVCCMFGIPAYYFKVAPNSESADYSFKEYVLHHVEAVKIVKIVVADGEMPSSNPQMTEFDFDWGDDWTVEVGKTDFARAFGDTAFPKQFDFIYVPMMKRMYDVNSAYDEKNEGLMWRSTTWKLNLHKHNENTSVDYDDFDNVIDSFIVNNYEETFGVKEEVEQERTTATTQMKAPLYEPTNIRSMYLEDAIRASISNNQRYNISDRQINHGSMTVARNFYTFTSPGTITYQKGFCGDSGTMSLIVAIPSGLDAQTYTLVKIDGIVLQISKSVHNVTKITFSGIECIVEENKTYLVLCRWNRKTQTKELQVYEHKCMKSDIPTYMLRPEMYKFSNEPTIVVGVYDGSMQIVDKSTVSLNPFPFSVTNFKLYETYLSNEEAFSEAIKYTTTNMNCVINDVARKLMSPHGYSPR